MILFNSVLLMPNIMYPIPDTALQVDDIVLWNDDTVHACRISELFLPGSSPPKGEDWIRLDSGGRSIFTRITKTIPVGVVDPTNLLKVMPESIFDPRGYVPAADLVILTASKRIYQMFNPFITALGVHADQFSYSNLQLEGSLHIIQTPGLVVWASTGWTSIRVQRDIAITLPPSMYGFIPATGNPNVLDIDKLVSVNF